MSKVKPLKSIKITAVGLLLMLISSDFCCFKDEFGQSSSQLRTGDMDSTRK